MVSFVNFFKPIFSISIMLIKLWLMIDYCVALVTIEGEHEKTSFYFGSANKKSGKRETSSLLLSNASALYFNPLSIVWMSEEYRRVPFHISCLLPLITQGQP